MSGTLNAHRNRAEPYSVMGNEVSGPQNELDIDTPPFYFDHENHTSGLRLEEHYQAVTFPPGGRNLQLAFFHQALHKSSTEPLSLRMKVHCGKQSAVMVGFSERPSAEFANVAKKDLCLFDVTRGRVYLKDCLVKNVDLPQCEDGGVIELVVSPGIRNIRYSVDNPQGSLSQPMDMRMEEDVTDEVWPLVGVPPTNKEEVKLELSFGSRSMVNEEAKFDSSTFCGPLEISNSGKVVSRGNISSNCCAVVNKILTKGRHKWTLLVHQDVGASTCLGIAKSPFRIPEHFLKSSKHIYRHNDLMMWRSYRGFLYADGYQLPKTLEPLNWLQNQSTKVEFELDLDKGTLQIVRNGEPIGTAFEKIKPPVQPAIAFYAGYEKCVELYSFETEKQAAELSDPVPLRIEHALKPSKPTVHFDLDSRHGTLCVSEDGTTVFRSESQQGNAFCLLNVKCDHGVYRWSFLVQSDNGASTCIGITTQPVDAPDKDNIYNSKSMFLYRSFQGMLYLQGREMQKRLNEFWINDTLVELVLDLVNGVLQFIVNGEDQGVAFTNLTGPYYPVVAFYAGMEKRVSLQHFEQLETSTLVAIPLDENDLNKGDTEVDAQSKKSQLPIRLQSLDIKVDSCMVCGVKDSNVVSLPCKHAIYCAVHNTTNGRQRCLVCDKPITGVWNLF